MSSDVIDNLKKMREETLSKRVPVVKRTPIEVIPKNTKNGGLLNLAKNHQDNSLDDFLLKEKDSIKSEYLKIYNEQIKSANYILSRSLNTIMKVFKEILSEEDVYVMDNMLLSDRVSKVHSLRERRNELSMIRTQLEGAISRDMTNYYVGRYNAMKSTPVENIEIVRKVTIKPDKGITLSTDENMYQLDSRKMSYYGGFIYLRRNILTENLDLVEIAKSNISKSDKLRQLDAANKLWSMVNPWVMNIDEKVVIMSPKYLQESLVFLLSKLPINDLNKDLKRELKEAEAKYRLETRQKVEKLMKMEVPPEDEVILFPFSKLSSSGIEFVGDFDSDMDQITQGRNDCRDQSTYISWNMIEELKESQEIDSTLFEILAMIKSCSFTEQFYSGKDKDDKKVASIYIEAVMKMFNPDIIRQMIDSIKSSSVSRDWSIRISTVKSSLEGFHFRVYEDDRIWQYIVNELGGEDRALYIFKELEDVRLEVLKDISDFLKEYENIVKKSNTVQSWVNSFRNLPVLNELEDSDILEISYGYKNIKLTPIVIDYILEDILIRQDIGDNILKFPKPIFKIDTFKSSYSNVRKVIKLMNNPDSDWCDILKIAVLGTNVLNEVGLYIEFKALQSDQELNTTMKKMYSRGLLTDNVQILSTDENRFNKMISELIKNYLGLVCVVDWYGLMKYVDNVGKGIVSGNEIIKFIPSPTLVGKYYSISTTGRVLPNVSRSNLFVELSRTPPTYLALIRMLNSAKDLILAHGGMEMFQDKDTEGVNKYEMLCKELRYAYASIKNNNNIVSKYDTEHTKCVDELKKMEQYLMSKRNKNSIESLTYIPTGTNQAIEFMLDSDDIIILSDSERFEEKDKYKNIKNRIKELNTLMDLERIQARDTALKNLELKTTEVRTFSLEIKKILGGQIHGIIDELLKSFNKESMEKMFDLSWDVYKFSRFTKGRILKNMMKAYIEANIQSPYLQAAMYAIYTDCLYSYREQFKEITKRGRTEEEVCTLVFRIICGVFGLDTVLNLTDSQDKIELEAAYGSPIENEAKKEIIEFVESLSSLSEAEIPEIVKNFKNNKLIPEELYLDLVYGSNADEAYPNWSNSDLNLAEVIKTMLLCGVKKEELLEEHLKDARLMSIVDSIIIDPNLIESIKRGM